MQASASFPILPKLVYVDYRGIQSMRYTPGALTTKQFDAYVEFLAKGLPKDKAKQSALESPKR